MSACMRRLVVPAFVLVVLASCSSSSKPDEGPPLTIGWVKGAAEAANGPVPKVDLGVACGSDSATFLAELQSTPAFAAKVQYHWGDCVEGGKQVMVNGVVVTTHLGPTDLPFDHPYGDDLSMNVNLDPDFAPFAIKLGTGGGENDATPGQTHVEIADGFIPHVARPANPPTGQTYRALADFNLDATSFQPGFAQPAVGDRAIIQGRWIIDCGHDDFSAELHAMSFLGWAHVDGAKTTARLYYNPYRDTEQYSLAPDKLGAVNDGNRLADGLTFPKHLVREVLGLDNGTTPRLSAFENVEAVRAPIADFRVCAPQGTTGALTVASDLVVRPGVNVTLSPNDSTGCVTVHVDMSGYQPADAVIRQCVMPWSYLNDIVKQQVKAPIDLLAKIDENVSTADGKMRAAQDPLTGCADALAGPPVTDAPTGQSTRVEAAQPFPIYGVVTATRP